MVVVARRGVDVGVADENLVDPAEPRPGPLSWHLDGRHQGVTLWIGINAKTHPEPVALRLQPPAPVFVSITRQEWGIMRSLVTTPCSGHGGFIAGHHPGPDAPTPLRFETEIRVQAVKDLPSELFGSKDGFAWIANNLAAAVLPTPRTTPTNSERV
jgi:hypothetical protein